MMKRFVRRMLFLPLACGLLWSLSAAEPTLPATGSDSVPAQEAWEKPIKFTPVSPGPADGRIAFLSAKMLEQLQYLHQPFTPEVSSKFLDRYLEALDPQHMHFL